MTDKFKNFFSATKNVAKRSTVGILCIVLVGVFVVNSCDKWERLRVDELIEAIANYEEPCYCIMDTLKGEWEWFETYYGFMGQSYDNRFKSVIKILGQNPDSSINYEIWVKDTLFWFPHSSNKTHDGIFLDDTLWYQGSFQILYKGQWGCGFFNFRLPHELDIPYYVVDEWSVSWWRGKDTIEIMMPIPDGYRYLYKRME